LALIYAALVIGTPAGYARQNMQSELEIIVIQGDGATHVVNSSLRERPIVEVRRNGQPVKGATVKFEAPESGPGCTFRRDAYPRPRHLKTITMLTGRKGHAKAGGFLPNDQLGE
jgi:hypothetical protein